MALFLSLTILNEALIQLHTGYEYDNMIMNLMIMWKSQRNTDADTNPVDGVSFMTV